MSTRLQIKVLRSCWAMLAMLLLATAQGGCAHVHKQPAVKYQTVSASDRHDTTTAKQKHAAAVVFIEEGVHLNKAEHLLNEALVADVTYGPAHNSLGTLYFMQKKLYLAAWEFEYAAKLMPDLAQPYNNLGLVYEHAGKYEEAISYYSMALSRETSNPELIGNLVRSRLLNGDRSADLKQLLSDLALNHDNPRWSNWARDQVELAKFEEGVAGLPSDWRIPEVAPEQLPAPVTQGDVEPKQLPQLLLPGSVMPEAVIPALTPDQ